MTITINANLSSKLYQKNGKKDGTLSRIEKRMKKLRRKSGSFPIIDIYFSAKLGTLNWIKEGKTSLGIKIHFREKRKRRIQEILRNWVMEVYKVKKLTMAILKRFQRNSIISLFLIPQLGILFYMVLLGNMANFLIFSSWMI